MAAAERQAFDLILMDMQMPIMDGLTAIQAIRAREGAEGLPPVPVCVLTANVQPEHRDSAVAAGADAFLTKPIDAGALIALIMGVAAARTPDGSPLPAPCGPTG